MRKFLVLTFLLLALAFPASSLASSTAKSVVETQVEGEGEVYQSVETTVNGQTVRKESSEPGRLELEMRQEGDSEPTVTFSQENTTSSPIPTPTLSVKLEPLTSFASQITDFVKNLLDNLTPSNLSTRLFSIIYTRLGL